MKAHRSDAQAVQYSCDIKGIAVLVKNVIADSIAVVFDVREDLEGIYSGVLSCVNKDLSNPEKLVSCVVSKAQGEASAAYNSVEQFLDDLKTSVKQIKTKLHQCSTL